jgi:prepilin-type processing-associated H-X9-DG protein
MGNPEHSGGPGSIAAAKTYDWLREGKGKDLEPTVVGVIYERSMVTPKDIVDGQSHTILFGEKYVGPDWYMTGDDPGDNECMYSGYDNDNSRTTAYVPRRDHRGVPNQNWFGSVHASACNFVFCDGSVTAISYNVDPTLFKYLGSRADRQPIDMQRLERDE